MKKMMLYVIPLLAAILLWAGSESLACTVCHSKNPKMVKMHEELGFKDCFNCHGQGLKKAPEEQKVQMTNDTRCISCHKK